jgi:hydrogenase expression/formation protein HypC
MCLAVPGEIIEIIDCKSALVDFMGTGKKIAVDLIEDIRVGDYVIVHAGFAINKIDKKEALESIEYLKEIYGTA